MYLNVGTCIHACHHFSGGQRTTLVIDPHLTPPLRRVPLLAFHVMCHGSSSQASAFVAHLLGGVLRLQLLMLCALLFVRVLRILTLSGTPLWSCGAEGHSCPPALELVSFWGPRLCIHPFLASGSLRLCFQLQHSPTELSPQLPSLLSDI